MRALIALGVAAALLAGCGARTALTPPEGKALPSAPYGAAERPDADALLALEPQAAPERSVELRSESETRADDPFDLPPEE